MGMLYRYMLNTLLKKGLQLLENIIKKTLLRNLIQLEGRGFFNNSL